MRGFTAAAFLAAGLTLGTIPAPGAPSPSDGASVERFLSDASSELQAGEADKVLTLVQSLPHKGLDNAQAQNLVCRAEFTMGQWDAAIRACQLATKLDPGNSDDHMWLGRALGEKADGASFLVAYTLSKRVLAEFHRAAQLDPNNGGALSDLGEYYLEAPELVGGGLEKAESVAEELDRVDPARAANLRAGIARRRGDYAEAETELKRALAVSHHPALQWAALTRFYGGRGLWTDMEKAIHACQEAVARDPHAAEALYDIAGVLIRYQRNPELAVKLLQKYLASPDKTEEAPAFVAYARLARLQQQMGDAANAQVAMAAAYELAHEYRPAQDLRR